MREWENERMREREWERERDRERETERDRERQRERAREREGEREVVKCFSSGFTDSTPLIESKCIGSRYITSWKHGL